jgi:hypothetical protein
MEDVPVLNPQALACLSHSGLIDWQWPNLAGRAVSRLPGATSPKLPLRNGPPTPVETSRQQALARAAAETGATKSLRDTKPRL